MPVTSKYFPLGGGLDLKTPGVAMDPGRLIQAQNVEQKLSGGYARVAGYEKYDTAIVPGEGPILGVWYYNGKVYAFRNAVGGATAEMHESVGSGWTAKKTGLAPGGSYEFVNYNFAGSYKMYGVSGTHKAFEWDGTTWVDITTGMTVDTPEHIIAHKKHLFLSFDYSVQHSSLGIPTTFTPVTGAAEMTVEDGVTGFMQMSGGVLGIFGRNSTNLLQGSSSTDWTNTALVEHGNKIGAITGTIQQLGSRVKYLDDRGVVDFYTSQNFGDFADATISYDVQELLLSKKGLVSASCIVREKSQYRLFFSDGTGLYFTFRGSKLAGITRVVLPDAVKKVVSTENGTGDELILFGSDSGYVYKMESGNTFDGAAITSYMRIAYNHLGSPRQRKRFRRAVFDIKATSAVALRVKPDFKFGSDGIIPPVGFTDLAVGGLGSQLGSGLLGSFTLGAAYILEGQIDLPGHGDYVSLFFYSDAVGSAWEVDGILYEFIPGRGRR